METKEFRRIVDGNCRPPTTKAEAMKVLDDLIVALGRIKEEATKIGLAGDEIKGVRARLIREAEIKWMKTRYAVLDLSFMEQTREVFYGRNDKNPSVVEFKEDGGELGLLPVFVSKWDELNDYEEHYEEDARSFNRGMQYEHRLGTLPGIRVGRESFSPRNVNAVASLPSGINASMFANIRKCIAYLRMFNLMTFERGIAREGRGWKRDIQVGVLWAPTPESWTLKDTAVRPKGDPAVLVQKDDVTYLVGYYDTPDEQPIDNIIREFTSGNVGKALPKRRK